MLRTSNNTIVKKLPPQERLRLAIMIPNEMIANEESIDYSDSWTKQDLKDLTAFALSQGH
jgi:hypothetical protein